MPFDALADLANEIRRVCAFGQCGVTLTVAKQLQSDRVYPIAVVAGILAGVQLCPTIFKVAEFKIVDVTICRGELACNCAHATISSISRLIRASRMLLLASFTRRVKFGFVAASGASASHTFSKKAAVSLAIA